MVLREKPEHVRRHVAVVISVGFGVILCIVLLLIYTKGSDGGSNEAAQTFTNFYTTLKETTQSFIAP